MTLLQAHETRLKIKELESSLSGLDLMGRCEAEDEIIELKKSLGEFQDKVHSAGDECPACGS